MQWFSKTSPTVGFLWKSEVRINMYCINKSQLLHSSFPVINKVDITDIKLKSIDFAIQI